VTEPLHTSRGMVHVVDDDASVRTALSRLLRAEGFEVAAYGSASEFVERAVDGGAGCVVLDVHMPEMTGLDLQRRLAHDPDALPIVFLTGHGDIPASVQAMKAGAVDFLTKPVDRAQLLAAVELALLRDSQRRQRRSHLRIVEESFATLTQREREVFDLLVTGMLNKQVGFELGTTERTIKAHRAQILRKLGVASVADLVRIAVALGRAASGA